MLTRWLWYALFVLAAPSSALAGAWTLPQGAGEVIATFTTSTGTEQFDGSGGLIATPRYDKDELQTLFEYGVTDNLTAILDPGLQHVDIGAPTDAERTGLGYTEFGARYRLFQGDDWVFSGQATGRIPGTFDMSNPAAIGYNDVEADFRALFGHTFCWPECRHSPTWK